MKCDTYWGSHGCDLEEGHEGVHKCMPEEPCSEVDSSIKKVRYFLSDDTWSDWYEVITYNITGKIL